MTTPTHPQPIDEQVERAAESLVTALREVPAFADELRRRTITAAIRAVVESLQQQLVDEAKRAEQLATNCRWLIDRVDRIHRELCPDDIGTWQERVEQAVSASAKLRQQLAAREAEIERAVKAEREACKQIAADQLKLEQISGDGTARTILQLIDARTTPSTEGGR